MLLFFSLLLFRLLLYRLLSVLDDVVELVHLVLHLFVDLLVSCVNFIPGDSNFILEFGVGFIEHFFDFLDVFGLNGPKVVLFIFFCEERCFLGLGVQHFVHELGGSIPITHVGFFRHFNFLRRFGFFRYFGFVLFSCSGFVVFSCSCFILLRHLGFFRLCGLFRYIFSEKLQKFVTHCLEDHHILLCDLQVVL